MFLEQRITNDIKLGSSYEESYSYDKFDTRGGNTYTKLIHPYPTLRYNIDVTKLTADIFSDIVDLYHEVGSGFGGFRLKHPMDFTTNNYTGTPTDTDQELIQLTTSTYQLVRWYGTQGDLTQTRRRILKPVSGTTVISVDDISTPTGWSVDTATGIVTFTSSPLPSATVKGGCEFDIPMRFATDLTVNLDAPHYQTSSIDLIEWLNPE